MISKAKAKLKSIPTLREGVRAVRQLRRAGKKWWASASRERFWRLQDRFGADSTEMGTPKYTLKNAFEYQYLLARGEGRTRMDLTVLVPAKAQPRIAPITVEPTVYPSFETVAVDPPSYVAKILNGRVFGEAGSIVTPDDQYLESESHEHVSFSLDDLKIYQTANMPRIQKFNGLLVNGATLGVGNYYHFLLDCLPKLLQCRQYNADAFYLNLYDASFQNELLDLVGVSQSRIIRASNKSYIQASELVFSSFPGFYGLEPEWTVKLVRSALLGYAESGPARRIYISREDASVRRVENEAEVLQELGKHGFEKVSLAGLSVREQITLFANAEYIVSPHGAALANLVFSPAGTKVLELFGPNEVKNLYWRIANHRNLPYGYVVGEGKTLMPFDSVHIYGSQHIRVDLDKLRATLNLLNKAEPEERSEAWEASA